MNNYESIPIDTRNVIDHNIILNNDCKQALGRLWNVYLRENHGDHEGAEQKLQNFINELFYMPNRNEQSILDVINQKIVDIQREFNGNIGGLKRRKTGKKRKRTTKKTTKKRSNKKRKY